MTKSSKQIKKFDAEVGKVLSLMINSIYTNKEIFLRELISNASDACDKLRYESLDKPKLLDKSDNEFKIKIKIDSKTKELIISDNGIGMNKKDLINNLGTIANSGTQKFIEQLSSKKSDLNLIGQFGVGFYSAFMVSDKIKVITSKAGEKEVYEWISDGKGEYSIEDSNEELKRGTKIILKIKDSESEFLESHRIRHIINTYSDHVAFPIELIQEDGKEEIINKASAIWTRNASDITEKEYEEFFNHVSHFPGKPWMTLHNKVEGTVEYTNLLFIPDSKPFDLFHPDRKTRVKLYIKRVFISEEGNELIPSYLRFLRGVVDSEDLPLNISRETLQHNKIVQKIKTSIIKKVLSNLKTKAEKEPKEYLNFWKNFSEVLKEGLCESTIEEKKLLLDICKFNSTLSENNDLISLDQYIERMGSNQNEIYFLNGNNIDALRTHPQLEGFKKRGIEVLLLTDHVDNFWINVVHQYKDKNFKSITNEKIDLNKIKKIDDENKTENINKDSEKNTKLINFVKEILKKKIKDVIISSKLVSSPACISTAEGGMNLRMEKFLIEQNQLHSKSAKVLEINPNHPIFKKIVSSLLNNNKDTELNKNLIEVVYGQACLIEGDSLDNPSEFAHKLNSLLEKI
ncbi:molecular chaperone HtpG [Candidatus Aquarickettsia rohweri]|uniref:Chaperone protein HtpG n=1 Tax=Candidatus Aquarickettsia rohweri TaxID=2602574 RepID=A0A3S0FSZ7_9RICK|nr:molecular chaperone HtpG [Candidatus Aquarickettsia rohweri]RST70253.1 molecular chaperone HtpG [Candidatus Aquarickettsia rohweri]